MLGEKMYELIGEKMECIGQKYNVISVANRETCFKECKKLLRSMFSFPRDTSKCEKDKSCRCTCEEHVDHGKCIHRFNNDYNLYALTNYGSKSISQGGYMHTDH